jgi:hypothetical protein
MFFNCKISVTIGDKDLKTIVSVNAKNDGDHLGAECDVVVPINCRIQYVGGNRSYLTEYAKNLFSVGDAIVIKAQYEGMEWVDVFSGFIFDFVEGMPLTIKCVDYLYFLNKGIFGNQRLLLKKNKKSTTVTPSVGAAFKSITLQNLCQKILDFTNETIDAETDNTDHLELILPMPDVELVNITFAMMSPAAILGWLKKEMGINISLEGNRLYVNVASNTLNTVYLRTDRNVINCDLQRPDAVYKSFKVKAWFIREDGTKDSFEIGDANGTLKEVFFYKIKRDQTLYQQLATEALNKVKQQKYSGSVETLLYPNCRIFDQANYIDISYPARSANYVITAQEVNIDEGGFHRKLKLSFLSEIQQ